MAEGDILKQAHMKDEDGKLLTERNEVCERWEQNFKGFLHVGKKTRTGV